MTAVVCVDDNGGLSFNSRRQSQDRILREKLLDYLGGRMLCVSPYTSRQFRSEEERARVLVRENCYDGAGAEDVCFAEDETPDLGAADSVILFRWNRVYPSDRRADMSFLGTHTLTHSEDFAGSSHEKITMEVYTK